MKLIDDMLKMISVGCIILSITWVNDNGGPTASEEANLTLSDSATTFPLPTGGYTSDNVTFCKDSDYLSALEEELAEVKKELEETKRSILDSIKNRCQLMSTHASSHAKSAWQAFSHWANAVLQALEIFQHLVTFEKTMVAFHSCVIAVVRFGLDFTRLGMDIMMHFLDKARTAGCETLAYSVEFVLSGLILYTAYVFCYKMKEIFQFLIGLTNYHVAIRRKETKLDGGDHRKDTKVDDATIAKTQK